MNDPIAVTKTGRVRGSWQDETAVFFGIPYAAAPVGEHRFAAPQPPPPWDGVRDATRPGPTPQRRQLGLEPGFPEPCVPGDDTLNVTVYTPAPADPSSRLPVLVWIHGGGFLGGSPVSPWYHGRSFARDGVVTVALSYRLGFDGFGWIDGAPPNRGLLDQIAALRWVLDNVAEFGGDPDAVTIGGQSAGGISVMTLLATPRARPLFRAAICQSGGDRVLSAEHAESVGRELAASAGVEPTVDGWSQLTEEQVLDAQHEFRVRPPSGPIDPVEFARSHLRPTEHRELLFGPVVDGDLLPRPITAALADGDAADKPLLFGATAHEFTLWLLHAEEQLANLDVEQTMMHAGFPRQVAADYVAAHAGIGCRAALLGQLMSIQTFRIPLLREVGNRANTSPETTWLYDFRWRSPQYDDLAVHCIELPFVWDLLDADGVGRTHGTHPPQHLADTAHAAWVSFIRDGDPGWRPISHGTGMVLDENCREDEILAIERRLATATGSTRAEAAGTVPPK